MDYLVTWNCRHIANGDVIRRLLDANAELERPTPLVVTSEEILFTPDEDESRTTTPSWKNAIRFAAACRLNATATWIVYSIATNSRKIPTESPCWKTSKDAANV